MGTEAELAPRAAGPPTAEAVRDRLRAALEPLEKTRLPPLEELVLTILSQSTTDRNRDRAWTALRERFPTWTAVRDAAIEELEETVRVAGLGRRKARSIQLALVRLTEERGEPTLDHLARMSDADALGYLTSFSGIGVKTAACVLCFSLRRPVLPVDTHVLRVARRLGWTPPTGSADRAHDLIARVVAPGDRFELHLAIIELGRRWCGARAPACGECPLLGICPRAGV